MSRKDYELIARCVSMMALKSEDKGHVARMLGAALTVYPGFNRAKFLDACDAGMAVPYGWDEIAAN